MSNVTQSEAKKASLELARNSPYSQVFGDEIKLKLLVWCVKFFP